MNQVSQLTIKGQNIAHIFPADVLPALQVVSYKKGEAIALAGEEVPYLFILLSGRGVVKQIGIEGQETILGYVYEGDLIGEIEVFTHHQYLHYVYADSDATLLWLPVQKVERELRDHVPFLHFVMEGAFGKLLNRTSYFSDTRLYGHKTRTLQYIKDSAQRLQSQTIPFVISEVAPFIGVSERQLRRIIKELEAQGGVKKGYKTLSIQDWEVMQENEKK